MIYDSVTGRQYSLYTRHDRSEIFRSRHAGAIIRIGESKVIDTPSAERDGIRGMVFSTKRGGP